MTRTELLFLAVVVLVLGAPLRGEAADRVRVLLGKGTHEVILVSSFGMSVHAHDDTVQAKLRRVRCSLKSGRLVLNGEVTPLSEIWVRAVQGTMTVQIQPPHETTRPSDEFPRPVVMFGDVTSRQLLEQLKTATSGHAASSRSSPEPIDVQGDVRIFVQDGTLFVTNLIDLERYVEGVVPSEMDAGWHLEALKVQAVAARTYVLYQKMIRRDQEYDVVSTVQDQVYRGRKHVDQRVIQAVKETKGLAVTFQGRPILAAFSSTAAGPTEDALTVWSKELPYLKGVECPFDKESPYYQWKATFRLAMLEKRLRGAGMQVGTIATMAPLSYSKAGRVASLRILHSRGELVVRGEDFRRLIGYGAIPSTQFTIDSLGRDVMLSGQGFGHAVGLCQWGVKEQAELGFPFSTILAYYYPGTELTDRWQLDPLSPAPVHAPE